MTTKKGYFLQRHLILLKRHEYFIEGTKLPNEQKERGSSGSKNCRAKRETWCFSNYNH